MNILNEINAYLITKITPYSTIYKDVFPNDAIEEIMSRNDPSPAVEQRDLTGARFGTFNFSYYAKSLNSETARIQLEAILAALDFKELTPITGGTEIKLEVATTPAFVEKTEAGEVIFVTSLKLEYYKEA